MVFIGVERSCESLFVGTGIAFVDNFQLMIIYITVGAHISWFKWVGVNCINQTGISHYIITCKLSLLMNSIWEDLSYVGQGIHHQYIGSNSIKLIIQTSEELHNPILFLSLHNSSKSITHTLWITWTNWIIFQFIPNNMVVDWLVHSVSPSIRHSILWMDDARVILKYWRPRYSQGDLLRISEL